MVVWFFAPLLKPSPECRRSTGLDVGLWFFVIPLTQAEGGGRAKGKHEVAGHGPPRSPQAQGCALGEPSEPTDERGSPGFWGAGRSCASRHSRHRCLPARTSGVPFLSVPCFGHAKKGTRRTGAEPRSKTLVCDTARRSFPVVWPASCCPLRMAGQKP